jgi:hypothetical protein
MSLLNFDKSTMENISRRFTPGCCFTMTLIRREMDDYGRRLKMTRRVAMQTIFLPGFGIHYDMMNTLCFRGPNEDRS